MSDEVCKHSRNAKSCEICHLEETLQELEAKYADACEALTVLMNEIDALDEGLPCSAETWERAEAHRKGRG